jgi:deoxyribonuclease V
VSEQRRRCAATDVSYPPDGGAIAAVVICDGPRYGTVLDRRTVTLTDVEPYRPGAFYLRELPALRAVLAGLEPLDLLIVDGYVDLDPDGTPGLGAHARTAFGIPVIGVAKTAFATATHAVPVRRGQATRPLYVTAAGLPLKEAADLVRAMAGPHRLPDALRLVDRLTRSRT